MWIINWIPNFYYYLTMAGVLLLVASWALKIVPVIRTYALPIQIVGLIMTLIGIYWMGGVAVEKEWQARVKEVEAKLAKAEAKSARVNTKIVTKVVTKTQVIREKAQTRTKYIDREIVKYDSTCEIPLEAMKVLNAAVKNEEVKEDKK
jgi:hypothetical protein